MKAVIIGLSIAALVVFIAWVGGVEVNERSRDLSLAIVLAVIFGFFAALLCYIIKSETKRME